MHSKSILLRLECTYRLSRGFCSLSAAPRRLIWWFHVVHFLIYLHVVRGTCTISIHTYICMNAYLVSVTAPRYCVVLSCRVQLYCLSAWDFSVSLYSFCLAVVLFSVQLFIYLCFVFFGIHYCDVNLILNKWIKWNL